jgi:hypothetical protein
MRRVRITKFAALAALCLPALCLIMTGCAQLGPPLPPSLEVPKPPTDLHAVRKGNRVTLTWSEPTLTTDHNSIRYIGPTNICRSEKTDMVECGTPVAVLPAPPPFSKSHGHQAKKKDQHPTPETYIDTLPASALQTNGAAQMFYSVEILNRNNRGGGLSNRVDVPAVITLGPPSDLKVDLSGDGVTLSWAGAGNPHGEGLELIYRIYRREEKSEKDEVAGEIPIGDAGEVRFTDAGFEWEKTYLYRVTAVSVVKRKIGGEEAQLQIEGDDSAPVRVVAHDVFPPAVPGGLQAAYSGEGQKPFIDLIWAPVTNADLAGYNVYRAETGVGAAGSANGMVKVNKELVKAPAYRDFEVQPGKSYTYAVSAIDVRGNESLKSETATESVP